MSAVEANPAVTKKFGKGERSVPHTSQKARKFYPAYDEKQQKKVCGTQTQCDQALRNVETIEDRTVTNMIFLITGSQDHPRC